METNYTQHMMTWGKLMEKLFQKKNRCGGLDTNPKEIRSTNKIEVSQNIITLLLYLLLYILTLQCTFKSMDSSIVDFVECEPAHNFKYPLKNFLHGSGIGMKAL